MGLVRDLNSRMAQMPPLFQESQKLDESELVDSLANKVPRSHKAMLIYQGFNPETRDLETLVEHCDWAETTNNISGAKFAASDEDSEPRKKNHLKSKDEHGKKRQKHHSKLFMVKTTVTPPGSETSSRQKARNSLSSPRMITRGSPVK